MPFLGKDWRSSGDEWIKTEQGWERIKVLESILDNLNSGLSNRSNKSSLSRLSIGEENEEELDTNDISIHSDDESEYSLNEDSEEDDQIVSIEQDANILKIKIKKQKLSLRKLSLSTCSIDKKFRDRPIQPHIMYQGVEVDIYNREIEKMPRASVSEVLNALDMPGAVKDSKRFNYVCRLIQLIINEKFNQLSGNTQRTLFSIVKEMLIQVIKSQENTNTMRKLLVDFKKAIQDSTNFYYFYHIGSQKLGDRHLETINKWQKKLESNNQRKVNPKRLRFTAGKDKENSTNSLSTTTTTTTTTIESIPFDCQLEIMRRLNSGLDLVNLAKCNHSLNNVISQELRMWKDLCKFHFQQTSINSLVSNSYNLRPRGMKAKNNENSDDMDNKELDWKSIYFRLKGRYGHREVYADMLHQCFHCKCLFWKVSY